MGSLAQNSSGAIRCSCNTRFRRRFRRVPEDSGGFRCRWLMKFRRVPVQMADEVPESFGADGSGADGWWGSEGFWCRWLMRFRLVQMADEVLEGSGADGRWGSGGFRRRWLMRLWVRDRQRTRFWSSWWGSGEFQIADKVLEGPGQKADEIQRVLVQIADEAPEGFGADQKPSKIFQAVRDNTWVYFFVLPASPASWHRGSGVPRRSKTPSAPAWRRREVFGSDRPELWRRQVLEVQVSVELLIDIDKLI